MLIRRRLGRTALALLFGLGLLLPPSPASATVVLPEDPFAIDDAPDCQEGDPDVAALPGGGFVTVWTGGSNPGSPSSLRVYARIHDADRERVTAAFAVSDNGIPQSAPAVAARPDGRFLVVWRDGSGVILGRLFAPSGSPLGGVIQVGFFFSEGLNETPAAVALPDGGFAVVYNDEGGVLLRRFDGEGRPRDAQPIMLESHGGGFLGSTAGVTSQSVAVQPNGDLVVVYTVLSQVLSQPPSTRIFAMRIPAAAPDPEDLPILTLHVLESGTASGAEVGVDATGSFVVAWREEEEGIEGNKLYARRFEPTGEPRGAVFRVDDRLWDRLGDPEVLMDPAGSFLVGWGALINTDNISPAAAARSTVWVRVFDSQGVPQGPQGRSRQISPAGGVHREDPAFAWTRDGRAIAVWQEGTQPPPLAPAQCFSTGIGARAFSPGCLPGPGRLCLGEGRFQLEAAWTAPAAGGSGTGRAVPVTRDTGYFWFFDDENVELMVKVLDGRAINGNFWVFYGSLSNVAWTLTVTDLATGAAKTYRNPAGRLASRGDTAALPGADPLQAGAEVRAFDAMELDREALPAPWWEAALALPGAGAAVQPVTPPVPPCSEPDFGRRPGLCLNAEEFEVEVAWKDPFNGGAGVGQGVPLTADSGYFWFFDPTNVELVVKVLDGRAVNGKYWVFYGALTNVEYDMVVRHAASGTEKTYHNPPFRFRSRADTAAFPGNLP